MRLKGNNHRLHGHISNYRNILVHIDIEQMQFTKDTFDGSFQCICNKVFTHRPVSNGCIIDILGFTEEIYKHHCSSPWYTIDIITNSLVNVLEGIDFLHRAIGSFLLYYIVNMGKFYLDLEFTNGKYYLANILEFALVSEESGYAFHSYVSIHYSVPKRVQQLTGITNYTIKSLALPFREEMVGLVEFLHREQAQSGTIHVIIAHGGYSHDFPILLANCMKQDFDITALAECTFVDSMQILQDDGFKRPGLEALCEELNIKRNSHAMRCLYIENCLKQETGNARSPIQTHA